jgi:hypothetical protein
MRFTQPSVPFSSQVPVSPLIILCNWIGLFLWSGYIRIRQQIQKNPKSIFMALQC